MHLTTSSNQASQRAALSSFLYQAYHFSNFHQLGKPALTYFQQTGWPFHWLSSTGLASAHSTNRLAIPLTFINQARQCLHISNRKAGHFTNFHQLGLPVLICFQLTGWPFLLIFISSSFSKSKLSRVTRPLFCYAARSPHPLLANV